MVTRAPVSHGNTYAYRMHNIHPDPNSKCWLFCYCQSRQNTCVNGKIPLVCTRQPATHTHIGTLTYRLNVSNEPVDLFYSLSRARAIRTFEMNGRNVSMPPCFFCVSENAFHSRKRFSRAFSYVSIIIRSDTKVYAQIHTEQFTFVIHKIFAHCNAHHNKHPNGIVLQCSNKRAQEIRDFVYTYICFIGAQSQEKTQIRKKREKNINKHCEFGCNSHTKTTITKRKTIA